VEKKINYKKSEHIGRQPKAKQRSFVGQDVKAEQLQKAPDVIMKQGLPRNNNMEPGWLIGMTNNRVLQEPEIPTGFIKERVAVPGSSPEIPEMRDGEKEYPEQKEGCFRLY